MNDNVMKFENILPADFDGIFRFTNWTDEEFIGIWGKKEYKFPPNATSPMIMTYHSPLEIQNIRKKFAKDLAERDFYKGQKYKQFMMSEKNSDGTPRLNSIHQATAYSLDDLAEGIQKCLVPLQVGKVIIENVNETPIEDKLSKDEEGNLQTKPVDKKTSLRKRALEGQGLPE